MRMKDYTAYGDKETGRVHVTVDDSREEHRLPEGVVELLSFSGTARNAREASDYFLNFNKEWLK